MQNGRSLVGDMSGKPCHMFRWNFKCLHKVLTARCYNHPNKVTDMTRKTAKCEVGVFERRIRASLEFKSAAIIAKLRKILNSKSTQFT